MLYIYEGYLGVEGAAVEPEASYLGDRGALPLLVSLHLLAEGGLETSLVEGS